MYVKSKKVRGDVKRRGWKVDVGGGGGGLTYRGLTSSRLTRRCPSELLLHGEYTSASPRFCPREKSLLPESSDPPEAVPPLKFSDNLFLLIALSNDLRQPVLLDRLIIHSFSSRCGNI